jgi:hypothetical protein
LENIVKLLKTVFDVEVYRGLCDYLGINIKKGADGTMELMQPHLIQSINKDLGLDRPATTTCCTPAQTSKDLGKHLDEPPLDESKFQYRSVIGKLNYLEKCSQPDIAHAVHQCAKFSVDARLPHIEAVRHIGRYLLATMDKRLILDPIGESFECWVDASHAGEWNKITVMDDPSTANSRTGNSITYGGCPLVWASKMQTEIALSSTGTEYKALSHSTREVIPLMDLMDEAAGLGIIDKGCIRMVHWKVFEDNTGANEIARLPKMRPRTKHLNVKYHHFRDQVAKERVTIHAVPTEEQVADMLTKPVPVQLLEMHCKVLMRW